MARVQRANVILQVESHEVQHYMNLGYNLIDDNGAILKEAIPTNIGVLQTAYLEHTRKIAELERTVATLTQELTASKTVAPKSKTKSKDAE